MSDGRSVVVMKTVVMMCFLLVSSVGFAADKRFGNVVVEEVTSIYDADTFRVNIKGWPDVVGQRMSVRVLGVDAPEIRGKCELEKKAARRAKQFTVQKLLSAKKIELRDIQRGKYFRLLANVYVDGKSLAQALIREKHARKYDGGKRKGWCSQAIFINSSVEWLKPV